MTPSSGDPGLGRNPRAQMPNMIPKVVSDSSLARSEDFLLLQLGGGGGVEDGDNAINRRVNRFRGPRHCHSLSQTLTEQKSHLTRGPLHGFDKRITVISRQSEMGSLTDTRKTMKLDLGFHRRLIAPAPWKRSRTIILLTDTSRLQQPSAPQRQMTIPEPWSHFASVLAFFQLSNKEIKNLIFAPLFLILQETTGEFFRASGDRRSFIVPYSLRLQLLHLTIYLSAVIHDASHIPLETFDAVGAFRDESDD